MDAGGDGWEHLGAGLAEGGGAKEADKRERTIISLKMIFFLQSVFFQCADGSIP